MPVRIKFTTNRIVGDLKAAIALFPELGNELEEDGRLVAQGASSKIEGSPSDKSGKAGRATGASPDMSNVTAKTTTPGPNRYFTRVGWLQNFATWFTYQDDGFWHVRAQRHIEGVHAMEDARDNLTDLQKDTVDRFRKKIARRAAGKR